MLANQKRLAAMFILINGWLPQAMASPQAALMADLEQQLKLAQQHQAQLQQTQQSLEDSHHQLMQQNAELDASIKALNQLLEENRRLKQQTPPKKSTNGDLVSLQSP